MASRRATQRADTVRLMRVETLEVPDLVAGVARVGEDGAHGRLRPRCAGAVAVAGAVRHRLADRGSSPRHASRAGSSNQPRNQRSFLRCLLHNAPDYGAIHTRHRQVARYGVGFRD